MHHTFDLPLLTNRLLDLIAANSRLQHDLMHLMFSRWFHGFTEIHDGAKFRALIPPARSAPLPALPYLFMLHPIARPSCPWACAAHAAPCGTAWSLFGTGNRDRVVAAP